jgi:hypothetical protein
LPVIAALFKSTFVAAAAALARSFAKARILPLSATLSSQLIIIRISAWRILAEIAVIGFRPSVSLMFLILHSVVCHNFPPSVNEICPGANLPRQPLCIDLS